LNKYLFFYLPVFFFSSPPSSISSEADCTAKVIVASSIFYYYYAPLLSSSSQRRSIYTKKKKYKQRNQPAYITRTIERGYISNKRKERRLLCGGRLVGASWRAQVTAVERQSYKEIPPGAAFFFVSSFPGLLSPVVPKNRRGRFYQGRTNQKHTRVLDAHQCASFSTPLRRPHLRIGGSEALRH